MDATKTNWKLIGVVMGVFVAVGIVATYFLVSGRIVRGPVGKVRRERAQHARRQDSDRVDPGFRLSRGVFPASRIPTVDQVYWRVTNEQDDPLVVKGVTYNGEYEAELRGVPTPTFPVRLTIGESCDVLQRWNWQWDGYLKEIIYIDVHTDRGKFRYRPASRRFE